MNLYLFLNNLLLLFIIHENYWNAGKIVKQEINVLHKILFVARSSEISVHGSMARTNILLNN